MASLARTHPHTTASDEERRPRTRPDRGHPGLRPRWVRSVEAASAIAAATGAAALLAWIDAGTIAARLLGEEVPDRPTWMVGFGVALFTITLAMWVLVDRRHRPLHPLTRALCIVLGVANLLVAAADLLGTHAGWVLPAAHTLAGLAIGAVSISERRPSGHEQG